MNKIVAISLGTVMLAACGGHSSSSNGVNNYTQPTPVPTQYQSSQNQYDPNDPNNQPIQPNQQGYYVDPNTGNYYNPSNGQAYSRTGTLLEGAALGGLLGYLAGHHVANSQFQHSYYGYYHHPYYYPHYGYHPYYHTYHPYYHSSVVHVYHHYSRR